MAAVNDFERQSMGNICVNPLGNYNSAYTYMYLDGVSYEGGFYISLKNNLVGIAPTLNTSDENWFCSSISGEASEDYVRMYQEVVQNAQKVENDKNTVANDRQQAEQIKNAVLLIQSDVTGKASQVSSDKETVLQAKESVDTSEYNVKQIQEQVNQSVTGFSDLVNQSTQESVSKIEESKDAALSAIRSEEESSISNMKTEADQYYSQKKEAADIEIEESKNAAISSINQSGTENVNKVISESTNQISLISQEGQTQKQDVTNAGTQEKQSINDLSASKIAEISQEGTKQVGLVTQEGVIQVQRVQEASQAIQDSAEQINQNANDIVELYKEIEELDKKIESVLFAEYDGKVYSVFFEDSTVSMASTGEKEDDNAGIANPVPSTDTVSNENPYDSIPLFKPIECNGYVDEEGNPHITAIKGSPEFKEDGSNGDVCIALKTGYIRTIVDTEGSVISILGKKGRKVSVTDTWRESEYPNHPFVPYTGAIRLDGSVRPYILIPKYQAVSYNGSYYSLPGFSPAYNVSHNNQITTFQKRGKQYCGETNSDAEVWETLFEIVFATLNSQSIMSGCTSYYYQYQAVQAETDVKRIIITNSQANNILVGSCVSIGDKGDNTSTDRGNSYMHNLANRVLVTKIEALADGVNSAVYVDVPDNFTTTVTTYISTMPWFTGSTNSVKGTCGSPVNNTNQKYPFKFLGIEFALGQYIVRSDVILNDVYDSEADTYRQDIYTCLDCTKFATSITSDYAKVGYSIPDSNNSWQYISDLGFDVNNPHVRMAVKYGANSSQRYADGVHTGTRANGTREFLSLGRLDGGSYAGLRYAALLLSLSNADWAFAARPSYTGRRGTVAGWASKNNISIGGVL